MKNPLLLSGFISELGHDLPERMVVDSIELTEGQFVVRGRLREASERASRLIGGYLDKLRNDPAVGPAFQPDQRHEPRPLAGGRAGDGLLDHASPEAANPMNVADLMQWIAVARRHPLSALCAGICVVCFLCCWYIYSNMKWLELEHKQVTQDGDLAMASMISGPVRQAGAPRGPGVHPPDRGQPRDRGQPGREPLVLLQDRAADQGAHPRAAPARTRSSPDSRSLYKRIPFSIRATGTYAQTAAFLYAIETGPRLTYIPTLMYRRVELETANPTVILEMNVQMLGKK